MASLLPALHDLVAHLQETVLGLAFREVGNCLGGAIDVKLCECSGLFDAVALDDKGTSLEVECQYTALMILVFIK